MDNKITVIISTILGSMLGTMLAILFLVYTATSSQPKIDLPEEYENINPHEQLQGNYDKSTNTLHIWFNNKF